MADFFGSESVATVSVRGVGIVGQATIDLFSQFKVGYGIIGNSPDFSPWI